MLRIGAKKEIFLWKRERGFSANLLKGLLLALGFHLMLYFGLRITSPPNPDAFSLIAPVAVEIDLGMPQVMVQLPPQITLSPIERIEPPQLLEMPAPQLVVEVPTFHKALTHEPDFSEIEKIKYEILEDLEKEEEDD